MKPDDYSTMLSSYEQQKWFIPVYTKIIVVIPMIGAACFCFVSYLIIWKTPKLNGYFRWSLVESIVFPVILSLYFGFVFKPYVIVPYEIFWNYGYFQSPLVNTSFVYFSSRGDTWNQIIASACIACFYIFSLLFLSYVYLSAFIGKGFLHINKTLKIVLIIAAVIDSGVGIFLVYMSYISHENKQDQDIATVLQGNSKNIFFFTDLGGYILNWENSSIWTYVLFGAVVFWAFTAIIIGTAIFLRILFVLNKRKAEISRATAKLQRTFIQIIAIHVTIFVAFYGCPVSTIYFLLSWKFFPLSRYPVFPMIIIQFTFLPIIYSLVNVIMVKQVWDAFLKLLRLRKTKIADSGISFVSSSKRNAIIESRRRSTLKSM